MMQHLFELLNTHLSQLPPKLKVVARQLTG